VSAVVHSRFGGSSASRWMACPGSVALCATVPPGKSSAYAEEGTRAHGFAEHFLKSGERDAFQHIGMTLDGALDAVPLTEDMARAVQDYLDAVWAEADASPDAELYVEQGFALDLDAAEPGEVFGTNDALVYTPSKGRLAVFDYKHGAGVSVDVTDNTQLKFYAAGAALGKPWKIREIELIIVQPRAMDAEEQGAVKRWSMDPVELVEFKGELEAAVLRAKALMRQQEPDDVTYYPGDHCRWCPAAAVCPAKEQEALGALADDFASVADITADKLPEPSTLDVERLGAILKAVDVISGYGEQVRQFVESQMMAGMAVPGWKVVDKVGRRKWASADEDIAGYLDMMYGVDADQLMPRKLVTITEAERLLKAAGGGKAAKDDLTLRFTVKESSGRTIAPISDRREAVNAIETDFASVNLTA
jgi:hypothetical protein